VNEERIVAVEVVVLLLAIVTGLLARGRWRLSVFFLIYVLNAFTFSMLVALWRETFYTRAFFLLFQVVFDIAKLGIVLETGYHTFRAFPGARSTVRKMHVGVLATTIVALSASPIAVAGWDAAVTALAKTDPAVNSCFIWLTVALLGTARWYRVPVHPFHVAVLTGLAFYLGALSATLYIAVRNGFDDLRVYASVIEKAVFTLVTCWWAYLAWQPETHLVRAYKEVVGRLGSGVASLPSASSGFSGH
jgi:hypothetical protein